MPRERRKCNAPECTKWVHAQGLCNQHYLQRMRNPETGFVHSENGLSREKRLESLLSLCDGFLHTVNALSDRACRKLGQTRSAEAQRLYELALTLRTRIGKELRASPAEPATSGDWPPREFLTRNGYRVSAKHGAS